MNNYEKDLVHQRDYFLAFVNLSFHIKRALEKKLISENMREHFELQLQRANEANLPISVRDYILDVYHRLPRSEKEASVEEMNDIFKIDKFMSLYPMPPVNSVSI